MLWRTKSTTRHKRCGHPLHPNLTPDVATRVSPQGTAGSGKESEVDSAHLLLTIIQFAAHVISFVQHANSACTMGLTVQFYKHLIFASGHDAFSECIHCWTCIKVSFEKGTTFKMCWSVLQSVRTTKSAFVWEIINFKLKKLKIIFTFSDFHWCMMWQHLLEQCDVICMTNQRVAQMTHLLLTWLQNVQSISSLKVQA